MLTYMRNVQSFSYYYIYLIIKFINRSRQIYGCENSHRPSFVWLGTIQPWNHRTLSNIVDFQTQGYIRLFFWMINPFYIAQMKCLKKRWGLTAWVHVRKSRIAFFSYLRNAEWIWISCGCLFYMKSCVPVIKYQSSVKGVSISSK